MSTKKYKIFKTNSSLTNLDNILNKSTFISLFQVKHLNSYGCIELKKIASLLQLKTFVCKNTFFKRKISLLQLPSNISQNIIQGNLIILYSFEDFLTLDKNKNLFLNFLTSKTHVISLFFYVYNKFLFFDKFIKFFNTSEKKMFIQLIHLLENNNNIVSNNLVTSNKMILDLLKAR